MPDRGRILLISEHHDRWRPWRRFVWTIWRRGVNELRDGRTIEHEAFALTYERARRAGNRWMDA